MLELADLYQNDEQIIAAQDAQYGQGASAYIGKAIQKFYEKG